ncbi:MAG: hypothetical protein ACKO96_28640, partial [Flammeovirgaceae bacterium]
RIEKSSVVGLHHFFEAGVRKKFGQVVKVRPAHSTFKKTSHLLLCQPAFSFFQMKRKVPCYGKWVATD